MLLSFGVAYIHTTWRRVRLRRVRPSRRFASKRRQTPHVRYTYERYVLLSGSTRICMLSDEEEEDEHEAIIHMNYKKWYTFFQMLKKQENMEKSR